MKRFRIKNILLIGLIFIILISTVTGLKTTDENKIELTKLISSVGFDNIDNINEKIITNNLNLIGKKCYGYQAYPNPDLIVWFDIDNLGTLNTIGTPISSDKISGGTWIDGVWWCCEYTPVSNSNIWIIDHITGNMTLIGASGSSEGLHGLAYDDTTETMYACGATNLFTINMTTGAATIVGPFGISGCLMIGIACDGYGNMYGEDLHTDSIYSIDPKTGSAELIGPLNLDLNHGQDMAIDKEDGTCYLSAFTVHDGDEGAVYTCNLTTGEVTKIGNFGTVPTQITGFVIPYTLNNPPNKPDISGPNKGKVGIEYNYTFVSTDPDGDDIWYHICWGDKEIIYIYGPYKSGEPIILSYNWTEKGTYSIQCKTRDIYDSESEWTYLEVTMPKSYNYNRWMVWLTRFPLLNRLLSWLIL